MNNNNTGGSSIDNIHGDVVGGSITGTGHNIGKYVAEHINVYEGVKPDSTHNNIIQKPSAFRGEKRIFIGRQNYIDQIKENFAKSNDPISIIGLGGMGKSTLAFKAIHQCEDMFDVIIPIYFSVIGSVLNSYIQLQRV